MIRRFLAVALLGLSVSLTPVLAQSDAKPGSPRLAEPTPPGASLRQLAEDDADLQTVLNTLRAEAAAKGSVKVAVKTAVAFAPEARLGDQERLQQRREIAAAAKALRLALPAARSFEAFEDKPYVTLELDGAGLARLETLSGLVRIDPEDRFNWFRDFVRLKTSAVMARAVGNNPAPPSPAPVVTTKIVGGTEADPATHPFQVGLLFKGNPSNAAAHYCGGTLVADRFVVTAAHCSDIIPEGMAPYVQVLVGTQDLEAGGQRIDVARIHIHPRYDEWTLDHDVAVWELATPVTGIPFATLASVRPTVAGTMLRTTGWGELEYLSGNSPTKLMQVDVPFVPVKRRSCGLVRDVTPHMICAGTAGKDSCRGDSGGPLTINRGAGYTELVGIVSFGTDCGLANHPGVYANVAHSSINRFIQDIVYASMRYFSFRVTAQSVNEGERRVTLTIDRAFTNGTASVRFATADGTALNRSDFRSRSGIVRFRHGQSAATITITLVNDRVKEGDEAFTVTLSQPSSGWTIGANGTATVTITDND